MKNHPPKRLPREYSDEIMVSSEQRSTNSGPRGPGHHRKVEALRIEPVVEFHRSSSGRNLRLKHVSATTSASLLASPQRLTPHAPDRKRSIKETPSLGSPSVLDKSPDTRSRDNQQRSIRKPSCSKSTDRRSSFSISAHVLQELGFIRSKTPELEQIGQNQRLDEEPGHESPASSPPAPSPNPQLDQIVEDKQEEEVEEEGNRPVYQFDLWKRAAKSRALGDAITLPSTSSHASPNKPQTNVSRRGSYEYREHRWRRPTDNEKNDLKIDPMSLQRSFSTNGGLPSRIHMSRSTSDPPQELEQLSLTRSTSPTIHTSSHGRSSSSPSTSYTIETTDPDVSPWRKVELIGEGTFGKVYKTFNADTGEFVALKEIEIRSNASILQIKQVQKLSEEISVMKNLSHSHIVRYKGSFRTDHHFCIVMEYVPGGSIASMLKQSGAFREELVRKFTLQIVKGVVYLHQMGIIHRDIKGANVLVNDQGVLKLADFGCSKQLPQLITTSLEESLRSIRGSIPWMAPEVVRQTGHGFKADIWSIGATVIEMTTGTHPWPSSTNSLAAMYAIATATKSPPLPKGLSNDARSFLQRCFSIDPQERASAAELEQHAFLRY